MTAVGVCANPPQGGFFMPARSMRKQESALDPYLLIILGSAVGGAARYACFGLAARLLGDAFPWGTLLVNGSGSFVIGVADTLAGTSGGFLGREFVMAGLCGGFTTFSAFSLETLELARNGRATTAGANVAASVSVCLVAVWLGQVSSRALGGI
jgi:CrcB protein